MREGFKIPPLTIGRSLKWKFDAGSSPAATPNIEGYHRAPEDLNYVIDNHSFGTSLKDVEAAIKENIT